MADHGAGIFSAHHSHETVADGETSLVKLSGRDLRAYEVVLKHYLQQGNKTGFLRILRCVGESFLCRPNLPATHTLGRYFLGRAVELGDVDLVTQLVRSGADVTEFHKGQSVLHLAVSFGNLPMVEVLLAVGSDLQQVDARGNSLLFTAMDARISNKIGVMNWLINNGVDPTRRNHAGKEPIHLAATSSQDLVDLFIKAGCDVNTRDDVTGCTPLHVACSRCCAETVVHLISLGADINAASFDHETPLLKLLKYLDGIHDSMSRNRLRLAKYFADLGGHLGFLNKAKYVKNSAYRKAQLHFKHISQNAKQINSLQHIARMVLRESLGNFDLKARVDSLPVPEHFKQYILFADVRTADFLCNMASLSSSMTCL